jgi:hypothetical protein
MQSADTIKVMKYFSLKSYEVFFQISIGSREDI